MKEKDRETPRTTNAIQNDFSLFRLSVPFRLALMAAAYFTAIFLQGLVESIWIGLPFIFAVYPFLAMKKITNKPDDQGKEEWKPVTEKEMDRLFDTLKRSKALMGKLLSGSAFTILTVIIIIAGFAFSLVSEAYDMLWIAIDALFMMVPSLFFGNVTVYVPRELDMKATCFYHLMTLPVPEGTVLTPFFRFDTDKSGRKIPEDIKMMLEPETKPENLVGIQFQVAINNGPNGAVPYMYAVVLTNGRDNSYWKSATTIKKQAGICRNFIIEQGGDDEYGTVVIRQKTEGSGYHTTNDEISSLFRAAEAYLSQAG